MTAVNIVLYKYVIPTAESTAVFFQLTKTKIVVSEKVNVSLTKAKTNSNKNETKKRQIN